MQKKITLNRSEPSFDLSSPYAKLLIFLYLQGSLGIVTEARAVRKVPLVRKELTSTLGQMEARDAFERVEKIFKHGSVLYNAKDSHTNTAIPEYNNGAQLTPALNRFHESNNSGSFSSAQETNVSINRHLVKRHLPKKIAATSSPPEVYAGPVIEKVPHEVRFRTNYTFSDVLRAFGKSARPFTSLVNDVIPQLHAAINNGEELPTDTKEYLQRFAAILDTLAGLSANERIKSAILHSFTLVADALDGAEITKEQAEDSLNQLLNLKDLKPPEMNKPALSPQVGNVANKVRNSQLTNLNTVNLEKPKMNFEGVYLAGGKHYVKINDKFYPAQWHKQKMTWVIKVTDNKNTFFRNWLGQEPTEDNPSYIPVENDTESGESRVSDKAFQDEQLRMSEKEQSQGIKYFKTLKNEIITKFSETFKHMPTDEDVSMSLSAPETSKNWLGIYSSKEFTKQLDYNKIKNSKWAGHYSELVFNLDTYENIKVPEKKLEYLNNLDNILVNTLMARKPNHKLPDLHSSKRVPALIKLLIQIRVRINELSTHDSPGSEARKSVVPGGDQVVFRGRLPRRPEFNEEPPIRKDFERNDAYSSAMAEYDKKTSVYYKQLNQWEKELNSYTPDATVPFSDSPESVMTNIIPNDRIETVESGYNIGDTRIDGFSLISSFESGTAPSKNEVKNILFIGHGYEKPELEKAAIPSGLSVQFVVPDGFSYAGMNVRNYAKQIDSLNPHSTIDLRDPEIPEITVGDRLVEGQIPKHEFTEKDKYISGLDGIYMEKGGVDVRQLRFRKHEHDPLLMVANAAMDNRRMADEPFDFISIENDSEKTFTDLIDSVLKLNREHGTNYKNIRILTCRNIEFDSFVDLKNI